MVSRRNLLTSTATLASTTLAGCSTHLENETNRHSVSLYNGGDEPHDFAVTVTTEDGEEIFNREYDLGDRSADENGIIDGNPAEITVTIDDADPMRFPWAPQESVSTIPEGGCSEETSASLDIYYEIQAGEGITPIYGCETARDQ